MIFYNLEDKDRIFESIPYFYNLMGLYLCFWMDGFNPEKEYFTYALV
jgi:hypothetical protein